MNNCFVRFYLVFISLFVCGCKNNCAKQKCKQSRGGNRYPRITGSLRSLLCRNNYRQKKKIRQKKNRYPRITGSSQSLLCRNNYRLAELGRYLLLSCCYRVANVLLMSDNYRLAELGRYLLLSCCYRVANVLLICC